VKTYKFISADILTIIDDDGKQRGSCSVKNPDYLTWVAKGNVAAPADFPTQAELDAAAKAAKYANDVAIARGDTKIAALLQRTPAQIAGWINANFPSLTPAERDNLAVIAIAVSVSSRQTLDTL
jgi:hypothetical protein